MMTIVDHNKICEAQAIKEAKLVEALKLCRSMICSGESFSLKSRQQVEDAIHFRDEILKGG